jgi:hypothetical protein
MHKLLTALLLASALQQTAAEAWGPAPTPLPELGLKGTALLGGTVLGCSALAGSFAFVRQGEACLIERLGRYKRTLTAGLHPKLPFIESVAAYSSIRERVLDVPAQRCITKDNAPLSADAVVFYRITDLTKAKYAIDDYRLGVSNLVLTQLRSEIGQLTLDETFTAREQLNAILLREANAGPRGAFSELLDSNAALLQELGVGDSSFCRRPPSKREVLSIYTIHPPRLASRHGVYLSRRFPLLGLLPVHQLLREHVPRLGRRQRDAV